MVGPEQVYANPAANQSGAQQGAAEKLQAPQVAAPAGTVQDEAGTVTLRIFVDRSILEVYCRGAALTDRLYPEPSATGVDLFAEGGVAHAGTVSVWPLRGLSDQADSALQNQDGSSMPSVARCNTPRMLW